MARPVPTFYSTNVSAYTVPELLRLVGWINTSWVLLWKLTGRPFPDGGGHLVPCYWENMRCQAEDLSAEARDSGAPMWDAVRKFAGHWEVHYGRRPCLDPAIIDAGNLIFFSPGARFAVHTAYGRGRLGVPVAVAHATTFLRNGCAIVTASKKNVFPICPGSQLRSFRGSAGAMLEDHQRAVAEREDVLICDTFAEWVAAWDRHTEVQSQWELDRGLWKAMS